MTQENIVRIYLAALAEMKPYSIESDSQWDWPDVYRLADRIITEIEPLLDAYEMSETK
jgi:hypothetical protein